MLTLQNIKITLLAAAFLVLYAAFLVLYQTSKMGRFAELINSFYPLTNFAKCSILDVWQGFEYASDMAYNLRVSGSVVHTCAKVDTLHMVN